MNMTEMILKLYEIAKEYNVDLSVTIRIFEKGVWPIIFVRVTNSKGISTCYSYTIDELKNVKLSGIDVIFEHFKYTCEELERK